MAHVQGVYAAAITPRGKQGDVDIAATLELLDLLARGGVAGIALFTGVGEYAALTVDERSRLVYLAVKRSRVPVLVGVGSSSLDHSLALAREARDAGAAGLLLPPPYFYRHRQEDLHEFFTQFAAHLGAAGVPIFLSHQPGYVSPIDAETAAALIAGGAFAGIEDGSGDPENLARLQSVTGQDASILAGSDSFLPSAIRAGAHAAVSPAAGAVPELVTALDCAIRTGNSAQSARLEGRLNEFLGWCREFPEPAILKVAVELRGIKTGGHSVPIPAARKQRLEEFRAWFPNWLKG